MPLMCWNQERRMNKFCVKSQSKRKSEQKAMEELYSVSPKVFEKFWEQRFDKILLKLWKVKGSKGILCNFTEEFPKLLGEKKYKKFLEYANKNLTFNEFYGRQNKEFNYNDIGRYGIRRLQEKYNVALNVTKKPSEDLNKIFESFSERITKGAIDTVRIIIKKQADKVYKNKEQKKKFIEESSKKIPNIKIEIELQEQEKKL